MEPGGWVTSGPAAAACRANISGAGERRRRAIGVVGAVLAVGVLGAAIAADAPWYARAAVGLPVAFAAISLLQVRRRTCVARAREGVHEADDFTTTPMGADDVAASRRVAGGILRDSVLLGLGAALLAAGSAALL